MGRSSIPSCLHAERVWEEDAQVHDEPSLDVADFITEIIVAFWYEMGVEEFRATYSRSSEVISQCSHFHVHFHVVLK